MSDRPICEHVGVPRYDPNHTVACPNRAKWKASDGRVFCGRHIRYVGRVEPLGEAS